MTALLDRREALLGVLTAAAAGAYPHVLPAATARRIMRGVCDPAAAQCWNSGVDGQRVADLGNGTYRNPVLAGDHADPSVLRDGDTYYKVSSSFQYYPGLVIWKSHDLVNWAPLGPALFKPVGSVYAPDLVKHAGRYYIYFPAVNFDLLAELQQGKAPSRPILANYVVHADRIEGPWSDPVDLKIYANIDPGHCVGEDGKRYLFLSGGKLVPLSDDGLSLAGKIETVYSGWPIPEHWVVEAPALESPKLMRRDGWFYLFSAQGGTAGPPTSHMVVVARSRSVRGPWENCPHNPIVRTASPREPWWSRGHATPVEGPRSDWWLIYHAYENGMRTLGRQLLLEPMEWTADGWPQAKGGDLSRPLAKPRGGRALTPGVALSGTFTPERFGPAFAMYKPGDRDRQRALFQEGSLILESRDKTPGKSSPIVFNAGDRSYELSVELALEEGAEGGLMLFYDERFCCGLGADGKVLRSYKMGTPVMFAGHPPPAGGTLFLRVVNRENIATFFESGNGTDWRTRFSIDVAGYNHNVADNFLNLRPALFATKSGRVRFRNLRYAALGQDT